MSDMLCLMANLTYVPLSFPFLLHIGGVFKSDPATQDSTATLTLCHGGGFYF